MKKRYEVIWGDVAEKDLVGIIEFIADKDPIAARSALKALRNKAASLYLFPEKGRIVPELLDQGISQYRELIVSPWRILYKVEKKQVLVFSVLDARRNLEDILLRRLIDLERAR